jgi:hypothetical protein
MGVGFDPLMCAQVMIPFNMVSMGATTDSITTSRFPTTPGKALTRIEPFPTVPRFPPLDPTPLGIDVFIINNDQNITFLGNNGLLIIVWALWPLIIITIHYLKWGSDPVVLQL